MNIVEILLIISPIIVYMFLLLLIKNKRRYFGLIHELTVIFLIIALNHIGHYFLGKDYDWMIIIGIIVILSIVLLVQYRLKAIVNLRRSIKIALRLSWLLLTVGYIVLLGLFIWHEFVKQYYP